GILTPQMPTPRASSQPTAHRNIMSNAKEIRKPTHQPRGARRLRTMALILSVTDAKVCPRPASTGTRLATGSGAGASADISGHLRVGVLDLREVSRARPRVQFGEQRVFVWFRFPQPHLALPVIQITEEDRLRRARLLTGR